MREGKNGRERKRDRSMAFSLIPFSDFSKRKKKQGGKGGARNAQPPSTCSSTMQGKRQKMKRKEGLLSPLFRKKRGKEE